MVKPVIPRVYTLGKSPLLGLVTHSLARLPNQPQIPQIVALLESEKSLRSFLNDNSTITLHEYTTSQRFHATNTQLMSACNPPVYSDGSYAPIEELVLTIKGFNDVKLLHDYRHNLTPESNIVLLNSDRSYIRMLCKRLWKDESERPNLYQCLSDFRAWSDEDYRTNVLGGGSLKIAKIPRSLTNSDDYNYKIENHIADEANVIKMIASSDKLNPVFMGYKDFTLIQSEYMIIRACIGGITSVMNCTNGEVLAMHDISKILLRYIDDCIAVIRRQDSLLVNTPYANIALDRERLLDVIISLLKKTEDDSTQMRKQIRLWNDSEVEATVGYFAAYSFKNSHIAMLDKLLRAKLSLKKVSTDGDNLKYDQESFSYGPSINYEFR